MHLLLQLKVWLLVLLVSALGTIATLTYYYLGRQGTKAVLAKFPQLDQDKWKRVQEMYQERGSGLLFFSSIPMLGVLLTAAAGAFGIRLITFFVWVLLGRLMRNWLTLLLFNQTVEILLN